MRGPGDKNLKRQCTAAERSVTHRKRCMVTVASSWFPAVAFQSRVAPVAFHKTCPTFQFLTKGTAQWRFLASVSTDMGRKCRGSTQYENESWEWNMQSWYCRNFMTNWLINLESSPAILLPYTFVATWVFFCLLATAAGTEGWNDVMVVLWLQTPRPCVRAMHQHEFKGGIAIWVTRPFSPSEHWDKDMQLAPAINPPRPLSASPHRRRPPCDPQLCQEGETMSLWKVFLIKPN